MVKIALKSLFVLDIIEQIVVYYLNQQNIEKAMTERKISSLSETESLRLVETDANGYVNTLPSWYSENCSRNTRMPTVIRAEVHRPRMKR